MENMDPILDVNNPDGNDKSSTEDFQKFMYELFDKNGVLNDLRAYLRGHIVDVLKNAQVGNQPMCQVRFTERLRTTNQALNILLSEYLLQQHLNYTLSVFVSEIPLANMVFNFSKMLLQNRVQSDGDLLRFEENDIWSILNYLGIKCDAYQAYNVVSMYKSEDRPSLLLCILKCAVLGHNTTATPSEDVSPQSISPRLSSSESSNERVRHSRKHHRHCNHMYVCKSCQSRYRRLKEKYMKRKVHINKKKCHQSLNSVNVKGFMRDVSVLERNLIDEMFDQLKSVYESELVMMRDVERSRAQQSIVNSALELNRKRDQLNDEFKAREAQLESSIQERKIFLWGLAKSLKEQHKHMERAMDAVKEEGKRLTTKEEIMKRDLFEAEDMLKRKGEEMRSEIAAEVDILESYLHAMRSEKCNINKEREELDQMKDMFIFDKYIHMTKSNASLEQSTLTDLHGVHSNLMLNNNCNELNNAPDAERSNRVINNLKKPKNVNFSSEIFFQGSSDVSRERSKSTTSSEGSVKGLLERLQEENARLIQLASHQAANIEDVSSRQSRLQAELAAARATIDSLSIVRPPQQPAATIPVEPFYVTMQRAGSNQQASTSNQRKGAGEQLSLFTSHRVVVPGDTLPFLGKLATRHVDGKRHLANQWRMLRHLAPTVPPSILVCTSKFENAAENNVQIEGRKNTENDKVIHSSPAKHKHKVRSTRDEPSSSTKHTREKTATSLLNEAKKKLRKLEIETEAVESSYNEFRKQRNEDVEGSRSGHCNVDHKHLDTIKSSRVSRVSSDGNITALNLEDVETKFDLDMEAYLKEYKTKIDFDKYFGNKATSLKTAKPIPEPLLNEPNNEYSSKYDKNLIETPMTEFRKYYSKSYTKSREDLYKSNIKQKETELKILEDNLKKMYNIKDEVQSIVDTNEDDVQVCRESLNVVKEQIEQPEEINIEVTIDEKSENNLLVVVENSVERVDIPDDLSSRNDGMEMTIMISPKASVHISQENDDILKENIENITHSSSSPKLKEESEISSPESNLKSNVIESIHIKNDDNIKTIFSSSTSEASVNFADSMSVDVDIYNNRSSNNSPISAPKSPDDENFWES